MKRKLIYIHNCLFGYDYSFDNVNDMLVYIEENFGVKINFYDLSKKYDTDQIIDIIISKIEKEDTNSNTSLQFLQKIQRFVSHLDSCHVKELTPKTKLKDIFPKKVRKRQIRMLQQYIGINIPFFGPHYITISLLSVLFFASIFSLTENLIFIFILLPISILSFYLAFQWGDTLQFNTIQDLTDYVLRYHYIKARENTETVNKKEIRRLLKKYTYDFFEDDDEVIALK